MNAQVQERGPERSERVLHEQLHAGLVRTVESDGSVWWVRPARQITLLQRAVALDFHAGEQ